MLPFPVASLLCRWEQFVKKLPQNEGRYAVVDFLYTRESDNVKMNKLIFVSWFVSLFPFL